MTLLPLTVAVNPLRLMAEATALAWLEELVVAFVAPLMICTPFTVMPVTIELLVPEKVIDVFVVGGERFTTGTTPATDVGPVIVTTEPLTEAL